MADRETVTTRLQVIHTWAEFAREYDLQFFTAKHLEDIAQWADDAIELLKEQEAVKPKSKSRHGEFPQIVHRCGHCNEILYRYYKYCPTCGRQAKWE